MSLGSLKAIPLTVKPTGSFVSKQPKGTAI